MLLLRYDISLAYYYHYAIDTPLMILRVAMAFYAYGRDMLAESYIRCRQPLMTFFAATPAHFIYTLSPRCHYIIYYIAFEPATPASSSYAFFTRHHIFFFFHLSSCLMRR